MRGSLGAAEAAGTGFGRAREAGPLCPREAGKPRARGLLTASGAPARRALLVPAGARAGGRRAPAPRAFPEWRGRTASAHLESRGLNGTVAGFPCESGCLHLRELKTSMVLSANNDADLLDVLD